MFHFKKSVLRRSSFHATFSPPKSVNRNSSPLDLKESPITNQRGQGLIEYLIVVALMGVATIAIVSTLSSVVRTRFAIISAALQGDTKAVSKKTVSISESQFKRRDIGDFFRGSDLKSGDANSDSAPNGNSISFAEEGLQ